MKFYPFLKKGKIIFWEYLHVKQYFIIMHELSIAQEIIENIIRSAQEHNAEKIEKITLEVGKLLLLNPEQLKFGLELLSKDTPAEGMEIEIKFIPAKIKCKNNHITSISPDVEFLDIARHLKCSCCDSEVEIIGGRELIIKRIVAE